MLALGDEVVHRGSYARQRTSITFSSTSSSHAASDNAAEESNRRRDKIMQNLMHNHQHILGILHVRVSYMLNLSNSIW
jgi:hypothetical protein